MTLQMNPFSAVLLGPPGVGKSTLAGSICEVVDPTKVLVLACKPGEENSWLYRKYNVKVELFFDSNWKPTLGKFQADAFLRLLKRLDELLQDEEYEAIIVDPGTDAINLLEHFILAPNKAGSPGDMEDSRSFYRQLADKAQELMTATTLLSTGAAKKPKIVLIPWHTQPVKEGQFDNVSKSTKESADQKSQGVEFEGQVLPMIEGKYRRKLTGDFDAVLYCYIDTSKSLNTKTKRVEENVKYLVQTVPNKERHAKQRLGPVLEGTPLPNSFKAIIEALKTNEEN